MDASGNSTIVLISQKVKDIKTPASLTTVAETVGHLANSSTDSLLSQGTNSPAR